MELVSTVLTIRFYKNLFVLPIKITAQIKLKLYLSLMRKINNIFKNIIGINKFLIQVQLTGIVNTKYKLIEIY